MDNDIFMPLAGANIMIQQGHCIVHIRHWTGPYFLCAMKYDPVVQEKLRIIPSWQWMPDMRAFKIFYLDMPTLESVAALHGYAVKYDVDTTPILKGLKELYLERKEWKKKALVTIPMKRDPRVYQTIGAQFLYKAKRALNADAMGSGKSTQAIGAILLNKMDGLPYKTLILCPSSVKGAWAKEIQTVTDELRPLVLESNMEKRYEQYEHANLYDVLIMSYEGFLRDYDEIPKRFTTNILICDEIHRIANRQNKTTQVLIGGKAIKKTFIQMAKPDSVYLLTGTPINNKLEDLYSMMKLMEPGIFSWTGFSNRYCIEEEAQRWRHVGGVARPTTYRTIVGYQNEPELKAKLALHMIRRTKDELLPELPEKVFETIEIELDAEERKMYNELRKDFRTFVRGREVSVADKLSWMTRAQQICNSLETLPKSPTKKSSKLEELVRIVDAEAKNRKIVIFSKYKTMTGIIERELRHLHPLHLNGDTPSEERTKMIATFQDPEDKKHRVFISTIKAGGVGITLTAADLVIFYDMAFTPAANAQAADRCHRLGQKNSVLVLTLKVKDSIEDRIIEICMNKQNIVDEMVGDEASVMNRMIQEELETLI